jgi:serine/threonine protein kinase
MDKIKSRQLEQKLKGTVLSGFEVIELINNGKSAAVFRAERDKISYALKIFDNDLIERFGHEIQTKRIEQEIALKNHSVNNLVSILDGGKTSVDAEEYYFIVMELLSGKNLKQYIETSTYDEAFIINVIKTLHATTEELLGTYNIVHRDIKPENIMVTEDQRIVLMDLGVLKLVGAKSFSDQEEKQFVGTLRYAPPEFLLRTESDTKEGWRAVNLYQIGATAHDLIMKVELFADKIPYSNLVIAIKDDTPKVSNPSLSFDSVQLIRDMLSKVWSVRLTLCPNERIERLTATNDQTNEVNILVDEILKMRLAPQAKFEEIQALHRTKQELRERQKQFEERLIQEINSCFKSIQSKQVFTSFQRSDHFRFSDDHPADGAIIRNYLFEIKGDLKMGFPRSLFILLRFRVDKSYVTEIEAIGIFPSPFIREHLGNPNGFFQQVIKEKYGPYFNGPIPTIKFFTGMVEFDTTFFNYINAQLLKLIRASLKAVETKVADELEREKERVTSKRPLYVTVVSEKSILINVLA